MTKWDKLKKAAKKAAEKASPVIADLAKKGAEAAYNEAKEIMEYDSQPQPRRHSRSKKARKVGVPKRKVAEGKIGRIVGSINRFAVLREPSNELPFQNMLFYHLKSEFPDAQLRYKIENLEIDIAVGKVGIEVKKYLSKAEADRLFGQVHSFLNHLSSVIVVLYPDSKHTSRQWSEYFKENASKAFGESVVIVEK